jgi:3-polyprenyl-4-hydroxybenzoate decarboxylase
MLQVADGQGALPDLCTELQHHELARQYLFIVLVSEDVPLKDPIMRLWGWFTRFDPNADLHPAGRRIQGNRLVLDFPIIMDARWKTGYPQPVAFDPRVAQYVSRRWPEYGLGVENPGADD